jgi:hypothetical protein
MEKIATRIVRMAGGAIVADTAVAQQALLPSKTRTYGSYEWRLSRTFAENEYVRLSSVELDQQQQDGKAILRIEAEVKIRLLQTLRPTLDVRLEDCVVFRSVFPDDADLKPGARVRYAVDLPLTLLAGGSYVADFNFVSIDRGGAHSLKTKGLLSIITTAGAVAGESGNGKTSLLRPDFVCTIGEIREPA